jgi:hypothetical protein
MRLQSGTKYGTYMSVFSALNNKKRVTVNITVTLTSPPEGFVYVTEESNLLFLLLKLNPSCLLYKHIFVRSH